MALASTRLLHLLIKALETEQTGHITVSERYFEVTGRIEPGQFFRFGNGGIVIADGIDDFIALENNFEAPALAVVVEFFLGDVDDHILEIVDEQYLSFDPIRTICRPQRVLFNNLPGSHLSCQSTPMDDTCDSRGSQLGEFQ